MKLAELKLTETELDELMQIGSNMGKNSHIGNLAVNLVKFYFTSIDRNAKFKIAKNGGDIEVEYNGKVECFEIKGTASEDIAWQKLKVSSKQCYTALISGMKIIRVTNVGKLNPILYLLSYGEHFKLVEEPRWRLSKI